MLIDFFPQIKKHADQIIFFVTSRAGNITIQDNRVSFVKASNVPFAISRYVEHPKANATKEIRGIPNIS